MGWLPASIGVRLWGRVLGVGVGHGRAACELGECSRRADRDAADQVQVEMVVPEGG